MKVAIRAWRRCALAAVVSLAAANGLAAQPAVPPLPDAANSLTVRGQGMVCDPPPWNKPSIFDNDLADVDFGAPCQDAGAEFDDCEIHDHRLDGMWFGGVEYLLVRPHFSDAVALVNRTVVTDQSVTPQTSTQTDADVEYQYNYQSSFRMHFGRRLCECGGDVQFTYWRLQGDSDEAVSSLADLNAGSFSAGQLEVTTIAGGDRVFARSSVNVDIFDVELSKCLTLGGPVDDCADCGCPLLDVRWSVGLRGANVNRHDRNFLRNAAGRDVTSGDINADFSGAGPKFGLQARRYFGECGTMSLYAKSSAALLVGEYSLRRIRETPAASSTGVTVRTVQDDDFARLVPVAEIEVGGSWQIMGSQTFVSAGWFFQSWWDLGSSQQVASTNFGPVDDSNILGFNGLFLRLERLF